MHPRLLVFDLDGTLIDSEQDLANSVNATLAHLDRPPLPVGVIRTYIGDGVSMLVRRALGDFEGSFQNDRYVNAAVTFFLDYYRTHKLDHTRPYPGVLDALVQLRARLPDCLFAVLTNKPVRPSREICAGLGLSPFFFQIYGGDSFHQKKPHPQGLQTLIAEATAFFRSRRAADSPVLPLETVMIGDSPVDIAVAQAAGTVSVGCTFGLSPAAVTLATPTAIAHSAADWLSVLANL